MSTSSVKAEMRQIISVLTQQTGTLTRAAVTEISDDLRQVLADVFALYVKTKGCHWHISGKHFRDYHLLLDEQAEQIFAMTDEIAERDATRTKSAHAATMLPPRA